LLVFIDACSTFPCGEASCEDHNGSPYCPFPDTEIRCDFEKEENACHGLLTYSGKMATDDDADWTIHSGATLTESTGSLTSGMMMVMLFLFLSQCLCGEVAVREPICTSNGVTEVGSHFSSSLPSLSPAQKRVDMHFLLDKQREFFKNPGSSSKNSECSHPCLIIENNIHVYTSLVKGRADMNI